MVLASLDLRLSFSHAQSHSNRTYSIPNPPRCSRLLLIDKSFAVHSLPASPGFKRGVGRDVFTCCQADGRALDGALEVQDSGIGIKRKQTNEDLALGSGGCSRQPPSFVNFISDIWLQRDLPLKRIEGESCASVSQGRGSRERKLVGVVPLLYSCVLVNPSVPSSLPFPPITMQDLIACVVTLAGALGYLRIFDELANRNVLEKKLSRKLVHIGVGLGFMLYWPLFSHAPLARFLAALAPAGNGVRMLGLGFGLLKNDAMVKSMSREGDPRELLKGPFYYALAVSITTVGFWRSSPIGIVALVNLCAGDGFADIVGRNFGGSKLPWNKEKSYAGSLGFFTMSTLVSIIYLKYFAHFGFITLLPGTFLGVVLVSFLSMVVESLPISTSWDDNLTVPLSSIVLGMLFLPA